MDVALYLMKIQLKKKRKTIGRINWKKRVEEHNFLTEKCLFFLDASSHLHKRVCPSVRPSVRPLPIPKKSLWTRLIARPGLFYNTRSAIPGNILSQPPARWSSSTTRLTKAGAARSRSPRLPANDFSRAAARRRASRSRRRFSMRERVAELTRTCGFRIT